MRIDFLRLTVAAFFVALMIGCASTASDMLAKHQTQLAQVPSTFNYMQLTDRKEVFVIFHLTDEGVYVDQLTPNFDLDNYERIRKEYKGKGAVDCLKMGLNQSYDLCVSMKEASKSNARRGGYAKNRWGLPPDSIFLTQTTKNDPVSTAIVGSVGIAIAPICIFAFDEAAACAKSMVRAGAGIEDKVDSVSIYRVGQLVNAALYRDYSTKVSKLNDILDKGMLDPSWEAIRLLATEFPRSSMVHEAMKRLTTDLTVRNDAAGMRQVLQSAPTDYLKDPMVYRDLLQVAVSGNSFSVARVIYQNGLKGRLGADPSLQASYKQMALREGDFDDVFEFTDGSDREALKLAFDRAKTTGEKMKIESLLLWMVKDKFVNTRINVDGTGQTSSSGGNEMVAVLGLGRRIESEVVSRVDYEVSFNRTIHAPKFDYRVKATVRFDVKGRERGWRNCGFLWLGSCEFDEPSVRTFEKPIQLELNESNSYAAKGKTNLAWNPVSGGSGMASGMIFGGSRIFQGDDLSARLIINSLEAIPK